jgi:hypothetical protein
VLAEWTDSLRLLPLAVADAARPRARAKLRALEFRYGPARAREIAARGIARLSRPAGPWEAELLAPCVMLAVILTTES